MMSETENNLELRSEEVQEILTKVPNRMIRWGNMLFLLLIFIILFLSWLIKYPDVIATEAMITTTIPPQKEYARITGNIDSIYVVDNQEVYKGQLLAVIENSAVTDDALFLKSILDTFTVRKGNFKFPVSEIPILFLGDIDQFYTNFENNYTDYVLNKKFQPFFNESLANRISLSELQNRLSNLREQQRLYRTELELKKNNLDRNLTLFEKGVISSQEYENKQLEYINSERNFKNIGVTISQLNSEIAFAVKTSKGTLISKSTEELQLLKNVYQTFTSLKKAVKEWENTYLLKSEIQGKVTFLNYWSPNQTVFSGDHVFTIIPTKDSNYIAKLVTPARNSGKIKKGQMVNVMLANYPEEEFGVLKGTVKHISLVPDNQGNYIVDVLLPDELISSYGKRINFKHEMPAQAEIITEDLRLLERFFYQFRSVFSN